MKIEFLFVNKIISILSQSYVGLIGPNGYEIFEPSYKRSIFGDVFYKLEEKTQYFSNANPIVFDKAEEDWGIVSNIVLFETKNTFSKLLVYDIQPFEVKKNDLVIINTGKLSLLLSSDINMITDHTITLTIKSLSNKTEVVTVNSSITNATIFLSTI